MSAQLGRTGYVQPGGLHLPDMGSLVFVSRDRGDAALRAGGQRKENVNDISPELASRLSSKDEKGPVGSGSGTMGVRAQPADRAHREAAGTPAELDQGD